MTLIFTGCVSERGFPPEHQIVNFDKVTTELYRGAQPNFNGFYFLAAQGIKTVVNLRQLDDTFPGEEVKVKALDMDYVQIPLSGTSTLTVAQMNDILKRLEQAKAPVFVHCQFGCDRTGTVVACWRIRHGWTNEKALAEAKAYGLSPLLPGLKHFIKEFPAQP